jgi:hypothetical protein
LGLAPSTLPAPVLGPLGARVKIVVVIRRLIALGAAVACCFALASCSSSDKSSPKSPSSSPSSSGVPAYASGTDEHAAQQFASYWVDTLNKATVTGNTAQLKAISDKGCSRCNDFASQLKKIYSNGGHVETKGWAVQTMIPEAGLPKGVAAMKVAVKVAPQKVYATANSKPEPHKGGELTFRLVLGQRGNHWIVQNVDL